MQVVCGNPPALTELRIFSSPQRRQVCDGNRLEINSEVEPQANVVRGLLAREVAGKSNVCLTCSFRRRNVLLTKLALGTTDANLPILFLDTGYHFARLTSTVIKLQETGI